MARKRHSDEDILKLLREIEVRLVSGSDVCCSLQTDRGLPRGEFGSGSWLCENAHSQISAGSSIETELKLMCW
jgi:hypothetical protein